MTTLDPALAAQLEALRRQFASGLPTRLDRIDAALAACRNDGASPTAVSALVTALHSLGGAAGIFGFDELGRQAREAERQLMQWNEGREAPEPLEKISACVHAWRALC